MLAVEKLLSKFGVKPMRYDLHKLDNKKALLTVEEQLAIIGLSWKDSPVGWQLLLVEFMNDLHASRELQLSLNKKAIALMSDFKGSYAPSAILAITTTAAHEALNQAGVLCGECRGAGSVQKKNRHYADCRACDCRSGYVYWCREVRFASFSAVLPVNFARFKKYEPIILELIAWLNLQKEKALLSCNIKLCQIKIEEKEEEFF